ncbi:peptidyl-tRNA hydrolase [Trichinella spiralis]|uniref:peptidyl-tRNA hydrolase n=1 Tax=Trichinella spiralis TaxID=6334 RepID=UPI0001EFE54F|nr:peptidyl-tRNA hydrolase [Trichinella spiralis]
MLLYLSVAGGWRRKLVRSMQIQCADGVVIHVHIGRNLADVQVSSNLLEPQLWLGYPDRLIAPELLSRSGRTIRYMAIIIMHRKSIC